MLPSILRTTGRRATLFAGAAAAASYACAGEEQPSFLVAQADVQAQQKHKGALDPQEFKAFKLIQKEKLTPNTYLFRFELPNNQTSGLTVASCLVTRTLLKEKPEDVQAKAVVRPYTPVSTPDVRGVMDLIVKVYPTGKMSKHMGDMNVGDMLEMKGPIPKIPYIANMKKHIGMVAGGTGITPMLQVIDAVMANPEDKTKITLLYANQTPGDIIVKDRLDALAAQNPDRFSVNYVVDKPGWLGMFWKGMTGHINKDVLHAKMPPPSKDNMVFVCGPPGMMAAISGPKAKDFTQGEVDGALKELGYDSSMVYKF